MRSTWFSIACRGAFAFCRSFDWEANNDCPWIDPGAMSNYLSSLSFGFGLKDCEYLLDL